MAYIFHIVDESNNVLFTNTKQECNGCIATNANSSCRKLLCLYDKEERRLGFTQRKNTKLYLCSDCRATKTSKLFKEKVELLSYTLPSMLEFKKEIELVTRNEEREKYSKIVHNLKTLNGQSILSQYKFIPQDSFSENYENLFDIVLTEVKNRPRDATVAILRQSKNNEFMKTEFSTHEKLSIESPSLFTQNHVVRKVILNVYHSFDMDFKNKHVYLKIDDVDLKARFDYDTIRVAIFHIFSNAIKYIAKNSDLNIFISGDNNFVFVDFVMKSLFIYADEVDAIFEDHNSGKIANTLNLNGSGLGMGLIKKALTINGGNINVLPGVSKSRISGIDYGTNTFRIMLPCPK